MNYSGRMTVVGVDSEAVESIRANNGRPVATFVRSTITASDGRQQVEVRWWDDPPKVGDLLDITITTATEESE